MNSDYGKRSRVEQENQVKTLVDYENPTVTSPY